LTRFSSLSGRKRLNWRSRAWKRRSIAAASRVVRAADLDEAAHRLEAPDIHDVPVPVEGAPCEGASSPSSKNPDPSSDSSEPVVG
jgi:hypothetical protein